jgi:hypothetical protein
MGRHPRGRNFPFSRAPWTAFGVRTATAPRNRSLPVTAAPVSSDGVALRQNEISLIIGIQDRESGHARRHGRNSDLVMPKGQPNGLALGRVARMKWRGIKLVFISGCDLDESSLPGKLFRKPVDTDPPHGGNRHAAFRVSTAQVGPVSIRSVATRASTVWVFCPHAADGFDGVRQTRLVTPNFVLQ